MSTEPKAELAKKDEKMMEFVPFGAKDAIKLNINIVRNLVASPTRTGRLPSDQDCIKFLMMCQARRLNPFEGDAFMLGYDTKDGPKFSLITAHQAFLKRAELNGEYNGMKSGVIVLRNGAEMDLEGDYHREDDTVLGGWATVFFQNRQNPMHKRVRLSRFKKDTPIWREDPAGMICKCAEADALRSSFPTMLGGLYLKEEMEAGAPTLAVSKPIFTAPSSSEIRTTTVAEAIEAPSGAPPTPVSDLREMCKTAGITEEVLLEFMRAIGLADDDQKTLDEVHEDNPVALHTVIEQWDDFSKRMKV